MNFTLLLHTSLSLLLLVAIGYLLRKLGVIDDIFTKKLSGFVAKGAQPFLIAYSLLRLEYSPKNLKNGLIVLGFGLLAHLFMALIAKISFVRVGDIEDKKIHEYACVFSNCAFVGYPILAALFGEIGLFYGAFYVISFNLGVWSYGTALMIRGKSAKFPFRKVFLNVGTITCAVGLALYITRVPMPTAVLSVMDHMANLCTPLSLIVTGSLVAAMPLKALFSEAKLCYFSAVKLIALPLLAALILRFCGISSLIDGIDLSLFLVIMISLPSAAFTTLFAEIYDVKPTYAARLVCFVMLLSTLTVPLVVWLAERIFCC